MFILQQFLFSLFVGVILLRIKTNIEKFQLLHCLKLSYHQKLKFSERTETVLKVFHFENRISLLSSLTLMKFLWEVLWKIWYTPFDNFKCLTIITRTAVFKNVSSQQKSRLFGLIENPFAVTCTFRWGVQFLNQSDITIYF